MIFSVAAAIFSAQAQTELVQNGGFESASGTAAPGWTLSGAAYDSSEADMNGFPHSGSQHLNLAGPAVATGTAFQIVTIPNTPLATVKLSYWVCWDSPPELPHTGQNSFSASYQASGGGLVSAGYLSDPSVKKYDYQNLTADLTAFKGQSVTISFAASTQDNDGTSIWLDDVSVLVTIQPPAISTVTPSLMESSTNSQTLTITGSNFITGDTLTFVPPEGGTIASLPAKLTVVSSNQLTYKFTNATDSGTWSVMVNSADKSLHSGASNFIVSPPPVITSVSPAVMPPVNGSQSLSVTGSNFFPGDKLILISPDGLHQTNIASVTHATNAQAYINNTNNSGVWSVIVNTADNSVHSVAINFMVSYLTPYSPLFNPTRVAPINGFQPLVFTGENFQPGMTLSFVSPEGVTLTNLATNVSIISSTFGTCLFNDGGESGVWGMAGHSPDGLFSSLTNTFRVLFSPFKIDTVHLSGTNFIVSSGLQTNVNYVLEYTLSFANTNWIPVLTNFSKNTSIQTLFTNGLGADSGRFYRLRVLQ